MTIDMAPIDPVTGKRLTDPIDVIHWYANVYGWDFELGGRKLSEWLKLKQAQKAAGISTDIPIPPDKSWIESNLGLKPSMLPWLVAAGVVGWLVWKRYRK